MSDIRYHHSVKDVQGALACDAGPFARREWYALMEAHGAKARYATFQDADTTLVLPLTPAMQPLTNWYAFTWQPLGNAAPASPHALETLAKDLAPAGRIDFPKLSGDHAETLETAFRAAGWTVFREKSDTNHILLPAGRSFADYLSGRPGQLRTTIKRKAKKLDVKLSIEFDDRDWQDFEDIYRTSWKPAEGDPGFLREFARAESAAGHFLFGIAYHEGTPVAAQFWTVENGTAYIHKLAHREDAIRLSPGTVLTAELFQHVIDTAMVELVDFGTGDDPYKRDWMEDQRPRYTLTCLRAARPRNWPTIARRLVTRARPR